jgi:hypothetical protein
MAIFLPSTITYDNEFEPFLKVSSDNNHTIIWNSRDFPRAPYQRNESHPDWPLEKFYDLLDGAQNRISRTIKYIIIVLKSPIRMKLFSFIL